MTAETWKKLYVKRKYVLDAYVNAANVTNAVAEFEQILERRSF